MLQGKSQLRISSCLRKRKNLVLRDAFGFVSSSSRITSGDFGLFTPICGETFVCWWHTHEKCADPGICGETLEHCKDQPSCNPPETSANATKSAHSCNHLKLCEYNFKQRLKPCYCITVIYSNGERQSVHTLQKCMFCFLLWLIYIVSNLVIHEIWGKKVSIASLKTEEMTIPSLGSFAGSHQKTVGFLGDPCFHMGRSVCEGNCLPRKGSREKTLFLVCAEEMCPAPLGCGLVCGIYLVSCSCKGGKGVHYNMDLIYP